MQKRIMASILIGLFTGTGATSHAAETMPRQMDAHEHGHGELMMVHEGNNVMIELKLPGVDVVGFEHTPETEEQKNAVSEAIAKLRNAPEIFTLKEKAQCRFVKVQASSPLARDDGDHDHDGKHDEKHDDASHEQHEDEGHAEFRAEYHIHCEAPEHFRSLDVGLFRAFPSLEEIDYQILVPEGQYSGELEADKTLLRF
ncbi:MAG: DUF2796 domain-containing protein [Sneathiella sp.]|uniref:DUF2796 domain-containing protein n=1 Tax=Sneathiella sp. TaxID=1964365 RepID=UPI0030028FB7